MNDDHDPPAVSDGGAPPSEMPSLDFTPQVLRMMAPLAGLALVALLLGRVLAPALKGVGVGMSGLVHRLSQAGDVTSQIFAFAVMATAIVTSITVARSRLPLWVRFGAATLGCLPVLPTVWALHLQVNDVVAALCAASAPILALLATPTLLRVPFARAPGLVIGLVALAGLTRLGAVGLAFQAAAPHARSLSTFARGVATFAFVLDTAAVAVAFAWVAARRRTLTSPGTIAILAVALLCTRQALAGQGGEGHPLDLFLARAASRLLSKPEPAIPLGLQLFVGLLAPLTAIAALWTREVLAPLGAAVALALAAHGALEMPPCALMLVVAALGAALTARDGRGMWAALTESPVTTRTAAGE